MRFETKNYEISNRTLKKATKQCIYAVMIICLPIMCGGFLGYLAGQTVDAASYGVLASMIVLFIVAAIYDKRIRKGLSFKI